MKEHELNSADSFIAGWYIPTSICDVVLDFYKSPSTLKIQGVNNFPPEIDKEIKDSIDAPIPAGLPKLNLYWDQLQLCIDKYTERYPRSNTHRFGLKENMSIQHYPVGGGFKVWHSERSSVNVGDRHLVVMTYLNDVDDGGTQFLHQNITVKAEKGLTLIWPVDWTHTHRGQISYTKEKTIITGWLGFINESEK